MWLCVLSFGLGLLWGEWNLFWVMLSMLCCPGTQEKHIVYSWGNYCRFNTKVKWNDGCHNSCGCCVVLPLPIFTHSFESGQTAPLWVAVVVHISTDQCTAVLFVEENVMSLKSRMSGDWRFPHTLSMHLGLCGPVLPYRLMFSSCLCLWEHQKPWSPPRLQETSRPKSAGPRSSWRDVYLLLCPQTWTGKTSVSIGWSTKVSVFIYKCQ